MFSNFDFWQSLQRTFEHKESAILFCSFFGIALLVCLLAVIAVYFCFRKTTPKPIIATASVVATAIATVLVSYFGLNAVAEENLGWTSVIIAPFFNGFLSCFLYVLLVDQSEQKPSLSFNLLTSMLFFPLALTTIQLSILCLLLLEGTICILMAAPFLYGLSIIGGAVATLILFLSGSEQFKKQPKLAVSFVALLLVLAAFSQWVETTFYTRHWHTAKTTQLTVNAPVENVFKHVKAYPVIQNPNEVNSWVDLFFVLGLPAPTQSSFRCDSGQSQCSRECRFTQNITLKEKVTRLDENKELSFDVVSVVGRQNRLTGVDVHIMPGGAYFDNHKGQFLLQPLGPNKTLITGTTWYQLHTSMPWYAKPWADVMLQGIHAKVLNQIKKVSEQEYSVSLKLNPRG